MTKYQLIRTWWFKSREMRNATFSCSSNFENQLVETLKRAALDMVHASSSMHFSMKQDTFQFSQNFHRKITS